MLLDLGCEAPAAKADHSALAQQNHSPTAPHWIAEDPRVPDDTQHPPPNRPDVREPSADAAGEETDSLTCLVAAGIRTRQEAIPRSCAVFEGEQRASVRHRTGASL